MAYDIPSVGGKWGDGYALLLCKSRFISITT